MASDLDKADELMKEGKKEEAKLLITRVLQANPTNRSVYGDAVNIYLYGKRYSEAKEVFELYKQRTGKELTNVDFALEDIEQEEKEVRGTFEKYQHEKVKVFKRSRDGGGVLSDFLLSRRSKFTRIRSLSRKVQKQPSTNIIQTLKT